MTGTSLKNLCFAVKCESTYGAKLDWDKQTDWQKGANGYHVTLRYKRRQYSFDFWQGQAITDDPTAEGCLECLLSDAQAGELDFEDFCREFGYDDDSRSAERTWRACGEVNMRLRELLGDDFDQFLYAER